MSFDADDEILQDFLVEAGEILELLGEQLITLEQQPEDGDLLNAIFRGFHTIKGGAGFLAITPLVETCHRAEDVFNVLRQGQRKVTAELMDPVLETLDVVNATMDLIRSGEEPPASDLGLLARLEVFTVPSDESEKMTQKAVSSADVTESEPAHDNPSITDQEFSDLLDQLGGKERPASVEQAIDAVSNASDDITEDEFEALLDALHGKGKHTTPVAEINESPASADGSRADEISEDEFDALLDQIHGKGKHGVVPVKAEISEESPMNGSAQAVPDEEPVSAVSPVSAINATKKKVKSGNGLKVSQSETSVRVDTQRLDDIMNMVGELVLVRNRLSTMKAALQDEELATAVGNLDVVTADLQLSVMKTRMQPVKKVFGRFPRVVRDLARNLNKEVDLVMHGEDTDLDKNLVEALSDPLVHLIRNSVDHGIETPEAREKSGKPRRGSVVLSAAQEGDHILLSIKDDGKGMDADVLRGIAVERGMMDAQAAARLEDKECYNLIFQAGFSTKKEISDVSGRGVGMDVVKTCIAQVNGSVEIDSVKGKGSTIVIKLPLTLAILPTLMVVLGQQPFALPLTSVVEIFNLDLSHTNTVDGQLTIRVRGRALPLFYLTSWLAETSQSLLSDREHTGHVVVVNVGGMQVGLVVDLLVGQEEVVIKPLGALLQGVDGMAGATVTSDGKIALILDVPGLMRKYARRF